jgi:predicted nucleic acid-binding Zn ribbon protein
MTPERLAADPVEHSGSCPHPTRGRRSWIGMGGRASSRDVLLAVALGSRRHDQERRVLPDRRSGIDRRKVSFTVPIERRSGVERRQTIRRKDDVDEGATLLQKARSRLTRRRCERAVEDDPTRGLR